MTTATLRWAPALAILALSISPAAGETTSVGYICRYGGEVGPGQVISEPHVELAADEHGAVAVAAIARAVRGEASLRGAWPLLRTLLMESPRGISALSGSYHSGFGPVVRRAELFLDAAARNAAGLPAPALRDLLGDAQVLTALREGGEAAPRRAADAYLERLAREHGPAGVAPRLLPLLAPAREQVSDRELVERAMDALDRGALGGEVAELLARTVMWDLQLYLAHADAQAALALPDEALAEDFAPVTAQMHLKRFLFGGREGAGDKWEAFEAERFIADHPDYTWVGHAAALLHELERGTVLAVTGEATPELTLTGATMPLVYTVEPSVEPTYAVAHLVWPRHADRDYEGVRCLADTASVLRPARISGVSRPSALRYVVAFTRPGRQRIVFQHEVYGVVLPQVTHEVEVFEAGAAPGARDDRDRDFPRVVVEIAVLPPGYRPVDEQQMPPGPGRPVSGGGKFIQYGDGQHGMEHLILYEVRVSEEDRFPGEITYCDPNPRGDAAVAERAVEEADRLVRAPLRAAFSMLPERSRVPGRECWVGRGGVGADGRHYYVLARGTQTYRHRRGWGWVPLAGEHPVYDATEILHDTVAVAEAALDVLRTVGPGAAPQPGGPTAVPSAQAAQFLSQVREIIEGDASLAARAGAVVAALQQQPPGEEARSAAAQVVAQYDALFARLNALRPPDAPLAALHADLAAVLGVGLAASGLIARGIHEQDMEKVTRGTALLHGHEAQRSAVRARTSALAAQYGAEP